MTRKFFHKQRQKILLCLQSHVNVVIQLMSKLFHPRGKSNVSCRMMPPSMLRIRPYLAPAAFLLLIWTYLFIFQRKHTKTLVYLLNNSHLSTVLVHLNN